MWISDGNSVNFSESGQLAQGVDSFGSQMTPCFLVYLNIPIIIIIFFLIN